MTNVIQLMDAVCTNDDKDPNFNKKLEVYRFMSYQSEEEITLIHIENLINTYGIKVFNKAIKELNKKQKAA